MQADWLKDTEVGQAACLRIDGGRDGSSGLIGHNRAYDISARFPAR
jgi:hypothetical protein